MSKREKVNLDMFIVDKEKEKASKDQWVMPTITTGFTTDGKKIDVKDFKCYCMVDVQEKSTRFWVKINTRGLAFNHLGYDDTKEYLQTMGKFKWQFMQVSETCFRNYLKFLRTGNQSYLRIAQREIS